MDTYTVETDESGGCHVRRMTPANHPGEIVGSFPTPREAERWINEQVQLALRSANASDVA